MRDRVPHHLIAKVTLRHFQQFRPAPALLDLFYVLGASDQIKLSGYEQNALGPAQRLVMARRTEMEMSRHQIGMNVRPAQFASHPDSSRAFPNGVFHIHDWRHQSHKSKLRLDASEQGADPCTVAGPEDAELGAALSAQCTDQLAQLDYALAQPFRISD